MPGELLDVPELPGCLLPSHIRRLHQPHVKAGNSAYHGINCSQGKDTLFSSFCYAFTSLGGISSTGLQIHSKKSRTAFFLSSSKSSHRSLVGSVVASAQLARAKSNGGYAAISSPVASTARFISNVLVFMRFPPSG